MAGKVHASVDGAIGWIVFDHPERRNALSPTMWGELSEAAERHAAGRKHMRGIIEAAQELGMTVGVSISPLEFPREFQQALPGSKVARQLKRLTITASAEHGPKDETLRKLVATKIRNPFMISISSTISMRFGARRWGLHSTSPMLMAPNSPLSS